MEELNYLNDITDDIKKYRLWILPNGKLLDASACSHASVIEDIYNSNIKKRPEADSPEYEDYIDEVFTYFNKLGWIQIGLDCQYVHLHSEPTRAQYARILEYLDYASTKAESFEVSCYNVFKTYTFSETTPDEIIKKIKRFFTTGNLVEDIDAADVDEYGKDTPWIPYVSKSRWKRNNYNEEEVIEHITEYLEDYALEKCWSINIVPKFSYGEWESWKENMPERFKHLNGVYTFDDGWKVFIHVFDNMTEHERNENLYRAYFGPISSVAMGVINLFEINSNNYKQVNEDINITDIDELKWSSDKKEVQMKAFKRWINDCVWNDTYMSLKSSIILTIDPFMEYEEGAECCVEEVFIFSDNSPEIQYKKVVSYGEEELNNFLHHKNFETFTALINSCSYSAEFTTTLRELISYLKEKEGYDPENYHTLDDLKTIYPELVESIDLDDIDGSSNEITKGVYILNEQEYKHLEDECSRSLIEVSSNCWTFEEYKDAVLKLTSTEERKDSWVVYDSIIDFLKERDVLNGVNYNSLYPCIVDVYEYIPSWDNVSQEEKDRHLTHYVLGRCCIYDGAGHIDVLLHPFGHVVPTSIAEKFIKNG